MNATASLPFPAMGSKSSNTESQESYSIPINMGQLSFNEDFRSTPIPFQLPATSSVSSHYSFPPTESSFPAPPAPSAPPAPNTFSVPPQLPVYPSMNEAPFHTFDPQPSLSLSGHSMTLPSDMNFPLMGGMQEPNFYSSAGSRRTSLSHSSSPHSENSSGSNNSSMPSHFRRYSTLDEMITSTPISVQRRSSLPTPFFHSVYNDNGQNAFNSSLHFPNPNLYAIDDGMFHSSAENVEAWELSGSPSLQPVHLPGSTDPNQMLGTPGSLQRARRRSSLVPAPNGEYVCPYPNCQKSFPRPHGLKSHMVMHSNIKPFKCPYCPLAMRRNHDLRRHMRLHSGSKPFSCTRCSKSFSRSDALKRHKKMDACIDCEFVPAPSPVIVV